MQADGARNLAGIRPGSQVSCRPIEPTALTLQRWCRSGLARATRCSLSNRAHAHAQPLIREHGIYMGMEHMSMEHISMIMRMRFMDVRVGLGAGTRIRLHISDLQYVHTHTQT